MAGRIRTIKPEWIEDERLAAANDAARVLSVALLLLADDHGNGRAHPAFIASHAWPYGDPHDTLAKATNALVELATLRFVELYDVGGQRYFHIRTWARHQKVQHPGAPRVPSPAEGTPASYPPSPKKLSGWSSGDSHEGLTPDLRPHTTTTISDLRPHTNDHDLHAHAREGVAQDPEEPIPETIPSQPEPSRRPIPPETIPPPEQKPEPSFQLTPEEPEPKARARAKARAKPAASEADATAVFGAYLAGWREHVGHGVEPKLEAKRRALIAARLKDGYTVAELSAAATGLWLSDWHRKNHRTAFEYAIRSSDSIERFSALANNGGEAEDDGYMVLVERKPWPPGKVLGEHPYIAKMRARDAAKGIVEPEVPMTPEALEAALDGIGRGPVYAGKPLDLPLPKVSLPCDPDPPRLI